MLKYYCHRKECTRIRSEFSIFMNRRLPPTYEGNPFCSDSCLRTYFESELSDKWRRLQLEKKRRIPRPKLGTILIQSASITRDQVEQAMRLQTDAHEGRIGEWLLKLGYVEEHQITEALARQYGLPLINLKNSHTNADAVRMIPGRIAKCSGLIPVGFDDSQSSLQVAVSAPIDFNSQEAIRRMVHKGIITYIGDQSVIRQLLEQWYQPEELDLSNTPTFSSLSELIDIGNHLLTNAIIRKANDIQAELAPDFFWIRLDYPSESHHHFFRCLSPSVEKHGPLQERDIAVGSVAGS
jgi:hypothetical protein